MGFVTCILAVSTRHQGPTQRRLCSPQVALGLAGLQGPDRLTEAASSYGSERKETFQQAEEGAAKKIAELHDTVCWLLLPGVPRVSPRMFRVCGVLAAPVGTIHGRCAWLRGPALVEESSQ